MSVNVGCSLRKTVLFENTGYKIAWWSYINLSIILKIKIWNELSVPPNVCQNWNSFCFIKLIWYTFVSKILLYYISYSVLINVGKNWNLFINAILNPYAMLIIIHYFIHFYKLKKMLTPVRLSETAIYFYAWDTDKVREKEKLIVCPSKIYGY